MMEHGTGAIQSPPDHRDLRVTAKTLDRVLGAVVLPPTFILGERPAVTNQGMTPECVPYAASTEQNWQDQQEHGRWYNFDQHRMFVDIGGTSAGSVMRYCLDRMLSHGFPEEDSSPSPAAHKIDGYFSIEQSMDTIKRAIVEFGGVLVIGPWWPNWEFPLGEKAVLPAPSGGASGHAWWAVGWDEYGLIGQNSWGVLWGDKGLFRMPWPYVIQSMWEVFKTADDLTLSLIAMAQIKLPSTYIRIPRLVVGEDKHLEPKSIWGQARKAGIWRKSTDSIVASPWDKPFKYRGKRHGARHGYGNRPETWALLGIAGRELAIPIPLVRLVNL